SHPEAQHNFVHEWWLVLSRAHGGEIRAHGEYQLILARRKSRLREQRFIATPVGIRARLLEYRGRAVFNALDGHGDVGRRTTVGGIENMCREITHGDLPVITHL